MEAVSAEDRLRYDDIVQVVEGPIPFFALCEHHALPFFGDVRVGRGEPDWASRMTSPRPSSRPRAATWTSPTQGCRPDLPVILATTAAGAERLRAADPPPNVRIEVVGTGRQLSAASLLDVAAPTGARLVVCEGGPHLIGDLVTAERLDELFLTVAPRLAGRDEANRRLGLVAGAAFAVSDAP